MARQRTKQSEIRGGGDIIDDDDYVGIDMQFPSVHRQSLYTTRVFPSNAWSPFKRFCNEALSKWVQRLLDRCVTVV